MKYARYKLIYNRKKSLNVDGKALLQIEISYQGKRKYISTGIYLSPGQWDEKNKRIIRKNNASYLMDEVRKIIRRCEDYEMNQHYNNLPVTIDEIISYAKNEYTGDSFIDFLKKDIENMDIGEDSKKHHRTTLKELERFGRIRTWRDLIYENIDQFNTWLLDKGLAVNTVANYHKHLKTHINRAIKKDIYDAGKNPYLKFNVKRIQKSRQALKEIEIQKIEKLDMRGMDDALEYTRDLFLFSCYTGLRYSDLMNLEHKNIVTGEDGIYIDIVPAKTDDMSGVSVKLPLGILFNGMPQKIIEKYMDRDYVFPKISNQHLNRYLKVIAIASGINKRLTFHMARHTFGTILADKTGDPFLIKSLMGHAKIETSMHYIHESQASNEKKLKKIEW